MRLKFKDELENLNDNIIEMGNLIELSIRLAISSFENKDIDLAKSVLQEEVQINIMEKTIERQTLNLLLKEQPVASDLRLISSSLKMITDMERIGDNSADIACLIIKILKRDKDYFTQPKYMSQMANATIKIVKDSIDSFVNRDLILVEKVILYDIELNKYFSMVKKELIRELKLDIDNEEQILDFLMLGKYLERIGDHAKNIAEWVYFAIEGYHLEE